MKSFFEKPVSSTLLVYFTDIQFFAYFPWYHLLQKEKYIFFFVNQILFPLKSSENQGFSDKFKEGRS